MSASASILHIDLDAFYVSMELLRHPELRGRPVIVAGGAGPRGVVNTCSYEARRFGVRSAMPMGQARRLCPEAVVLVSDFAYYAPASRGFHAIARSYSPLYEAAGADEAYLDVRGTERLWGPARAVGEMIRARVRSELGLPASVGIATNRLVAKVASDAAKPDGLLEVPPGGEAAFLAPRPLRDLPMIGPRTAEALGPLGLRTIGDLAAAAPGLLEARLGPHGRELRDRARGIYHGGIGEGRGPNRSISREVTFDRDESDPGRLDALIRRHADRVAADLLHQGRAARTVTLKLRFPPFETLTRAHSPGRPMLFADDIYREAGRLFERAWRDHGERPLRLLGVGVSNLVERARQPALGEKPAPEELARAVDAVRQRFGSRSVVRGTDLERSLRRQAPDP